MPRSLPEHKEKLLHKLIREGDLSIREIAERVQCGTGTVTRHKKDLGFEVRVQASQRVTRLLAPKPANNKGGRPPNLDALPTNSAPSAAALRLAAFDPIVARALRKPVEEPEDE